MQWKDLDVWKKSHELVLMVYEVTKTFPKNETYLNCNPLIPVMRRKPLGKGNPGFQKLSLLEPFRVPGF